MHTYKIEKPEEGGAIAAGLTEAIADRKPQNAPLHVALPGGRSILPILSEFRNLSRDIRSLLRFFLVDERIGGESNAESLKQNFFNRAAEEGVIGEEQFMYPRLDELLQQPQVQVQRQVHGQDQGQAEGQEHAHLLDMRKEQVRVEYLQLLPEKFDLILLGVGEDGHVASLFPHRRENYEQQRLVFVQDSPKPPPERLTLTFSAFNRDATVLLLFFGPEKREALENTLKGWKAWDPGETGRGDRESFQEERFQEENLHRAWPAAYFLDFDDLHIVSDQEWIREREK